jgi:pyruvate-formate lyase-activating enzyme
MIYNDPTLVTEFFYQLLNKTRAEDVHTISLVVEEGELDKYINKLIYLNDKIIKVRDSFI